MGDKTGIQWTDATWNPIRGCSRVSEGCRNCYAEKVAARFSFPAQQGYITEWGDTEGYRNEGPYHGLIGKGGQWNGNIRVVDSLMDQPLRWRKPRRIFVNSMSDLFHENVPYQVIDQVFAVMAIADHHVFQVLTKRPARMVEYLKDETLTRRIIRAAHQIDSRAGAWMNADDGAGIKVLPLPNVWLGVSVEDQATADERIPLLLQTPAAVRWISAEPLLGEVDLSWAQCTCPSKGDAARTRHLLQCPADRRPHRLWSIDWVVVGGESGPGARPMHPEWARSLRDQCVSAGVPFFFKQWGEWSPRAKICGAGQDFQSIDPSCKRWPHTIRLGEHGRDTRFTENCGEDAGNEVYVQRVGKKQAGRLLDGREWNEYPHQQEKHQ